eukprot:3614485-Alexandrium_andersonii.AAC.1
MQRWADEVDVDGDLGPWAANQRAQQVPQQQTTAGPAKSSAAHRSWGAPAPWSQGASEEAPWTQVGKGGKPLKAGAAPKGKGRAGEASWQGDQGGGRAQHGWSVSYTHLRAHETSAHL